jgi:serine/threonine protein kinase
MVATEQHREAFRYFSNMHLVFEFMNTDLCKLMESRNFLTPAQAVSTCHQIIAAVEYMHSANVIHRDIKPENILVTMLHNGKPVPPEVGIVHQNSQLIVKVADFGLARVIAPQDVLLKSRRGTNVLFKLLIPKFTSMNFSNS